MANLVALLALVGIILAFGFLPWRITQYVHGQPFWPRWSLPKREVQQLESKETFASAPTQVLGEPQEVQIGKSLNLKELEEDDRIWGIALAGMIFHLYRVYEDQEGSTIARDRYIEHGHLTSTEYEYLIGPEVPGKQATPGILRRAKVIITERGEGQVVRTIFTVQNPLQAIGKVFAYIESLEQNREASKIVSIAGISHLVPESEEEEEGFEYNDDDDAAI